MRLEIGYNYPFEIRTEEVAMHLGQTIRVLYLSDLHFNGYSGETVKQLIKVIPPLQPDVILLGGDYADTRKGLVWLGELLENITALCPVFAVSGNHDRFLWRKKIAGIMTDKGVKWLDGSSAMVNIKSIALGVFTNEVIAERAHVNMLLLHEPIDPLPLHNKFHIIFAGHLHGGQVVLWQNSKGLYPGKWLYSFNFLKRIFGDTFYFISKGLGDTLPLRFNCKKDIILVNIT